MKTAAVFLVTCLALGCYAPGAQAQEESPKKKIKVVIREGNNSTEVYEYNSREEMEADERLKGKIIPPPAPPLPGSAFHERLEKSLPADAVTPEVRHIMLLTDSVDGIHFKVSDDSCTLIHTDRVDFIKVREQADRLMQLGEAGAAGIPLPPAPPMPPLAPAAELQAPPVPEAPAAPGAPVVPDAPAVPDPVEAPQWLEELQIFPNPADDHVQVRFRSKSRGQAVLRLIDLNGRVVYEETIPDVDQTIEKTIKAPKGEKGMMVLQIQQGGNTYSQRVILK